MWCCAVRSSQSSCGPMLQRTSEGMLFQRVAGRVVPKKLRESGTITSSALPWWQHHSDIITTYCSIYKTDKNHQKRQLCIRKYSVVVKTPRPLWCLVPPTRTVAKSKRSGCPWRGGRLVPTRATEVLPISHTSSTAERCPIFIARPHFRGWGLGVEARRGGWRRCNACTSCTSDGWKTWSSTVGRVGRKC